MVRWVVISRVRAPFRYSLAKSSIECNLLSLLVHRWFVCLYSAFSAMLSSAEHVWTLRTRCGSARTRPAAVGGERRGARAGRESNCAQGLLRAPVERGLGGGPFFSPPPPRRRHIFVVCDALWR